MEFKIFGVILFMVIGLIKAEVINYDPCPGVSSDHCTISEIKIDPCKEFPNPCKLKKGTDATITFDFVPNFDATKLKSMVYWANGAIDMKFGSFNDDGCKLTHCPTTSGQSQQYNYKLYIAKKLPRGVFPLKWKLWNEDNEAQACCFMTNVNLLK